MLHYLPEFISLSLASKLAGLSQRAFRRAFIDTKRLKYEPDWLWHDGTGRSYVMRCMLEKELGRRFTLADCQAADRELEPRRRYQRLYRRGHRTRKGQRHAHSLH